MFLAMMMGPARTVTLTGVPANSGTDLRYVLITPARNEEAFIERVIQAVIQQTVLPQKWVIVSDGSTDRTDAIVNSYAAKHNWIELLRMPERAERHFAGKAHAFNGGYAQLGNLRYDLIGSLDADITFDPDYFGFLLARFVDDPKLGLAGTPFLEDDRTYDYRFVSIEHVSGACQLFRRECFEAIGGYRPIKGGGVDLVAVITARMKGWRTRTFTEKTCVHHRKMGSAQHTPLRTKFRVGQQDYAMGGHPLWELFRIAYQTINRPIFIGAMAMFLGYYLSLIRRSERPISEELLRFRRREQMQRLRKFVFGNRRAAKGVMSSDADCQRG